MTTKSATASWCALNFYFVAIFQMVKTRIANFGCMGGLLSLNFFISHAMGKFRACWAGEVQRGLLCPSRTYLWATARRAVVTD
jgi:hypothetical protein